MTKTFPELTDFNYQHILADCAQLALLVVTAPRCGACKHLLTALHGYHQYHPEVAVFTLDAVHNGGAVQALGVFHLPAVFLYRNGQYHAVVNCEASPTSIHHAVQQLAHLPAEEEP